MLRTESVVEELRNAGDEAELYAILSSPSDSHYAA
jgi:mannitol/fructose-specific phosphotransferase system IIA component (Ntr-type)